MLPAVAEIGGFVVVSVSTEDATTVFVPEGAVVTAPTLAVVSSGIGLRNASRKAGVPKVSVRAIPRTYFREG